MDGPSPSAGSHYRHFQPGWRYHSITGTQTRGHWLLFQARWNTICKELARCPLVVSSEHSEFTQLIGAVQDGQPSSSLLHQQGGVVQVFPTSLDHREPFLAYPQKTNAPIGHIALWSGELSGGCSIQRRDSVLQVDSSTESVLITPGPQSSSPSRSVRVIQQHKS